MRSLYPSTFEISDMQLVKLLIIFMSLNQISCSSGMIIKSSRPDESLLIVDAVVNIVKSCYQSGINTVGLGGRMPGILVEQLSSHTYLPVTLLDDTTMTEHNQPVNPKARYKLQLFIVTASSTTKLEKVLEAIKNSMWWNHMATLFIIAWPYVSKNGCSDAFNMLETAWRMDVLHGKFVCVHPMRGQLVYNFNPYTNYAPNPWHLENTYKSINDHPWTLFSRRYRNDERMCEDLDFEKENDLGGYEIRSIVKSNDDSWFLMSNKPGIDGLEGMSGITAKILLRSLNATINLIKHTSHNGFSLDQNTTMDIATEITNGNRDIGLNFRFHSTVENETLSYPFWYGGLSTLTQYRGYPSHSSKMGSIVSIKSQYGIYIVILAVLIFFKYFRNETLTLAILNTLRIVCNLPLSKLPTHKAARIFLVGLFLSSITIQIFYQGELASLLMKRSPFLDVDTREDLIDSDYIIYGYRLYASLFNEPAFGGRFVELEDFDCSHYVVRDSSAACVKSKLALIDEALELKLHLAQDIIAETRVVYVIRPNWPLEQRVNKIVGTLLEADIISRSNLKEERKLNILRFKENRRKSEEFKVITLDDLTFAFVIFGIGLGCATVSFIIEISM